VGRRGVVAEERERERRHWSGREMKRLGGREREALGGREMKRLGGREREAERREVYPGAKDRYMQR
jgi:hypothetical protein